MADNTETDVNELKRLRQLNFEQSKQISLLREFTKASDGATKAIIDKVTPSLIKLVEGSSALSAEIKKEVTSHKAAAIAIEKAFKNLHEAKKLADELKAGTKSAGDVKVALKALGIELEDGRTNAQKIANTFAKLDKESDRLTAGFADATQQLSKSSVKLSKELDGMRSRVTANIQNFFTLTSALGLATKAVTKFYDLGLDLVNKGMVGAMMTITTQSMALRMSVSELSELLGKSRGTILAIGGGQKGVNGFLDAVKRTSQGLELFGKDAAKISAGILDTLTKNGAGFGNQKIGEETLLYAEKMRDQYKEMYALFGDSAEEFTNYYDQLLKTESLQSRLNTLSSSQIRLMMQENMRRYENYRLMGLSNEQITNMNKTLEALYNPNKNRQVEAIKERYMGRAAISMSSNDLANSGDKKQVELGNRLRSALESGAYDKLRQASPQQRADMIANDKVMEQLVKDLAANDDYQRQQRDMSGGEESLYGFGASEARGKAGESHDALVKLGQQLNQAKNAGYDIRGETPEAKKRREEIRENAGFKTGADGRAGDMTATAETFSTLRKAVDQVSSLMANPLVAAIGAATAALVLFTGALGSASLAGKAMNLLKGGGKGALGKLGRGAGKMLGGGKAGMLGKLGLAAGAAYEGYQIYDKVQDANSSKIDVAAQAAEGAGKLSASVLGAAAGAAIGTAILPVIGTTIGGIVGGAAGYFGAGKLIDAGRSSSAPKTAALAPRAAPAPKANNAAKTQNEALMQKTLEDAGITDPAQKAILMGQLAHESAGFKAMNEIGGGAKYEGRKDLGNTQAGDGDKFRGRGFIQLTGRSNYAAAGKALGLDLVNNPDLAAQPEIAAKIALWYVQSRKNKQGQSAVDLAAQGDIGGTTKLINGGFNGLDDRTRRTSQYMQAYSTPNTTPIMNAVAQGAGPQMLTPAQIAATAGTNVATTAQGPDGLLTENQKQTALLAQQVASLSTIANSIVKNRTTEGLQADRQTASVIG